MLNASLYNSVNIFGSGYFSSNVKYNPNSLNVGLNNGFYDNTSKLRIDILFFQDYRFFDLKIKKLKTLDAKLHPKYIFFPHYVSYNALKKYFPNAHLHQFDILGYEGFSFISDIIYSGYISLYGAIQILINIGFRDFRLYGCNLSYGKEYRVGQYFYGLDNDFHVYNKQLNNFKTILAEFKRLKINYEFF